MNSHDTIHQNTLELFKTMECGSNENLDLFISIFKRGVDLLQRHPLDKTKNIIRIAAEKNYFNFIKYISDTVKEPGDSEYDYGIALSALCSSELPNIVKFDYAHSLLKANAIPEWHCFKTQSLPLHIAITKKDSRLAALLISFGADINRKISNQTPKQIDPDCFNQAWLIHMNSKFVREIMIVFAQAMHQDNPLKVLLAHKDIFPFLCRLATNIDFYPFLTIENACKFTDETRVFVKNSLPSRIPDFISRYTQPRHLFDFQGIEIGKSVDSLQLLKNIRQNVDSWEKVQNHIHDYLNNKSLAELQNINTGKTKCRAIDCLKGSRLIEQDTLQKYINQKIAKAKEMISLKVDENDYGFKLL